MAITQHFTLQGSTADGAQNGLAAFSFRNISGHSDLQTTHRYVNRTRHVINQAADILDGWQDQQQATTETEVVNLVVNKD